MKIGMVIDSVVPKLVTVTNKGVIEGSTVMSVVWPNMMDDHEILFTIRILPAVIVMIRMPKYMKIIIVMPIVQSLVGRGARKGMEER
jgi:nucleoside permease NupC